MNDTFPEIKENMRLEGRETTDVYVSEVGLICIRQGDSTNEEHHNIVCLLPADIPLVIGWLQKLASEAEQIAREYRERKEEEEEKRHQR